MRGMISSRTRNAYSRYSPTCLSPMISFSRAFAGAVVDQFVPRFTVAAPSRRAVCPKPLKGCDDVYENFRAHVSQSGRSARLLPFNTLFIHTGGEESFPRARAR